MGAVFRLIFYAVDEKVANEGAEAAFRRIAEQNAIFSDYDSDSEIMRLCDTPASYGKTSPGIPVSRDLWHVLMASQSLSLQSNGAFDITVGPLTKLWRRARRQHVLPADAALAAARARVGHQHVELVEARQAVRFRADIGKGRMRLDAGGIAKGYAADVALAELRRHGINRTLVDAGGDIRLGAAPPEHAGWRVGVVSTAPQAAPSFHLLLQDCGVATSGDLWQFIEIDGRRYSHIVDPRTGLGLTNRIAVTVVAADAMTADGLASTVSVLGAENGTKLLNTLPNATGRIVEIEDGQPSVVVSQGFADLRRVP
jgi:thiamine biosynthesis lipoprotein